jgi:hypothetical protein
MAASAWFWVVAATRWHGEVVQEGRDFLGAERGGVATAVEQPVAAEPVQVGLLGAGAVMAQTQRAVDADGQRLGRCGRNGAHRR